MDSHALEPPMHALGEFCHKCNKCCLGDPYTGRQDVYCPHFGLSDGVGMCSGQDTQYYKTRCATFMVHQSKVAAKGDVCTYRAAEVVWHRS